MYTVKNYNTWLLTESEDALSHLSEEPTNKEESPEYVEEYLNRETGETFLVVPVASHGSEDDLFAVCKDQEHKDKYEAGDDDAAEFIIFKPFVEGQTEDGSQYGFTYAEEDEDGEVRSTEEFDETFDNLEDCLAALVNFIKSGDEDETAHDPELEDEETELAEPTSFTEVPDDYADEGMIKSKLDAKKREAEDKKNQYLGLEKGTPEREAIAKEMIELNREIMKLEKQAKAGTQVEKDDEEDFEDVYEKKKALDKKVGKGEKVKTFADWTKKAKNSKDSKKEDKEEKKDDKKKKK